MINSYMGLVLAAQSTKDIRGLTKFRPIATIPFGGRYRVLDFSLTSLTRAGVKNVGIVVPTSGAKSLRDHVRGGQFWDLNRKDGGLFLLNPTLNSTMDGDLLGNFKSNLEYFHKSKEDYIIIFNGNLIANVNMKEVIEAHEKSGKDLTVVYKKVEKTLNMYTGATSIFFDENNCAKKFGTVINSNEHASVSLGIKIIKKELLINLLMNGVQNGNKGDLNSFVNNVALKIDTYYHEYIGYTRFISSTKNFFSASMDLLNRDVRVNLLSAHGGISTKINDTPPAHFEIGSKISNSLIANGCIVKGNVKDSIISRRVFIGENVTIENSIILQSCTIEDGAEIKNVIIDKNVTIKKLQQVIGSEDFPIVIEKKSLFSE